MFYYDDILYAYEKIKKYIYKTPLEKSIYLSDEKTNYYLKLECLQTVKSFKLRGALNKITSLSEEEKRRGVVAISSGNHGVAVSYASKILGIDNVEIIVPETTPQSKIDRIKYFGGKVVLIGANYDEAHLFGIEYIRKNQKINVDAYFNDPIIYAGQGTIAIEIFDQNPNIDTILVPIGGGGLITGIAVAAKAIKPSVRIIGLQTDACPAMIKSFQDNVLHEKYPTKPSICEALVGGVGKLAFEMARDYVDEIILIRESNIKRAVSHLIKKEKIVAEPSSAICVAAVMQEKKQIGGKNVALVISGGNINEDLMVEILNEY